MSSDLGCLHDWNASAFADYEECVRCGSFRSLCPVAPTLMYGERYWSPATNHSTIRDQVYNVNTHEENGLSKNSYVLKMLAPPDRDAVLEIACAPGILLKRLREEEGFQQVHGIEAFPFLEAEIRAIGEHSGPLTFGLFPAVAEGWPTDSFSTIVGMDVFEHCFDSEAFLVACARLLKSGGQLVLLNPIVALDEIPMPERMFTPDEHIFIPSSMWLQAALDKLGFRDVQFGRWAPGHEVVTAWIEG